MAELLAMSPPAAAAEAPHLVSLADELGLLQLRRAAVAFIAQHYTQVKVSQGPLGGGRGAAQDSLWDARARSALHAACVLLVSSDMWIGRCMTRSCAGVVPAAMSAGERGLAVPGPLPGGAGGLTAGSRDEPPAAAAGRDGAASRGGERTQAAGLVVMWT